MNVLYKSRQMDILTCGLCQFTCSNIQDFLLHKVGNCKYPGICLLCDQQFLEKKCLTDHLSKTHLINLQPELVTADTCVTRLGLSQTHLINLQPELVTADTCATRLGLSKHLVLKPPDSQINMISDSLVSDTAVSSSLSCKDDMETSPPGTLSHTGPDNQGKLSFHESSSNQVQQARTEQLDMLRSDSVVSLPVCSLDNATENIVPDKHVASETFVLAPGVDLCKACSFYEGSTPQVNPPRCACTSTPLHLDSHIAQTSMMVKNSQKSIMVDTSQTTMAVDNPQTSMMANNLHTSMMTDNPQTSMMMTDNPQTSIMITEVETQANMATHYFTAIPTSTSPGLETQTPPSPGLETQTPPSPGLETQTPPSPGLETKTPPSTTTRKDSELLCPAADKCENVNISSKKEKLQPCDFHFLLGTVDIQGASLAYERTEFKCLHCAFSTAWCPSLVKHMNHSHSDVLHIHQLLNIQNNDSGQENQNSMPNKFKNFKVMKLSDYLAYSKKSKVRTRKVESQDVPGKYHCPTCQKVFGRLRYLHRHQQTHHIQRAYLCDSCGKSFKTKAILGAHGCSHKTKNYHCPQCSFVSSSPAAIHLHRQTHPNGSIICDICGTAYIDKSTLNKHRKVHDLNRPFPCTYSGCTWRFKTDVMRKAHVRNHTTVGKFHCTFCGYNFRQKHHLQRHVTKIHNAVGPVLSLDLLPNFHHVSRASANHIPCNQSDAKSENIQELPIMLGSGDVSPPTENGGACQEVYVSSSSQSVFVCDGMSCNNDLLQQHNDDAAAVVQVIAEDAARFPGEDQRPLRAAAAADNISKEGGGGSDEVVQLVVGEDHMGNLVQYKIAYLKNEGETTLYNFCFVGQDGTIMDLINIPEQIQTINSQV